MKLKTNADVARRVRGLCAEGRVKQAELAATLSLSTMAISRRLSGETPFTPEELIKASSLLAVPISAFFTESFSATEVST